MAWPSLVPRPLGARPTGFEPVTSGFVDSMLVSVTSGLWPNAAQRVEGGVPDARWVSEGELFRPRSNRAVHVPDSESATGWRAHAHEVEVTQKSRRRAGQVTTDTRIMTLPKAVMARVGLEIGPFGVYARHRSVG